MPTDRADDDFDEQTTVDPKAHAAGAAPARANPGPRPAPRIVRPVPRKPAPAALRPGARRPVTSTTETRVAEDSSEILLEPSRGGDVRTPVRPPMAAGTGETGSTIDELTMAEEQEVRPPQLAVVKAPPSAPPGARQGARQPPPAGGGQASPAMLVVQAGSDRGRRFPVKIGRTSIGRGVENDVVLTDIAVSRRHLVIDFDGASFVMTDLGSGNGTLVNDQDEDGAYQLGHGDRLELGNTVLVFECPELAGRAAPPRAPGKARWSAVDEEMSTVAGRKPGGPDPLRPPSAARPRPASRPSAPPPIARAESRPSVPPLAAPPQPPPPQPQPLHLSSPPGAVAAPPMQAAPAQIPTISSEALGLGGPTPSQPGVYPVSRGHSSGPHGGGSHSNPYGVGSYSSGSMPPMGSGFSPYPPAVQYPSLPGGYGSTGSHSAPRFQYPNGVMRPPPGADRKRVLVAIIAFAFVAVGGGIVLALMGGGGEKKIAAAGESAAGSGAVQLAGAAETGGAGGAPGAGGAAGAAAAGPTVVEMSESGAGGEASGATGGEASGATGGSASGGEASGATGGSASGGEASGATGGSASGGDAAGGTGGDAAGGTGGDAAGGEPDLPSLFGSAQLNASVFGNDEQFLAEQPPAPVTGDSQLASVSRGDRSDGDDRRSDRKSERKDERANDRKDDRKDEPKRTASKKPERILEEDDSKAPRKAAAVDVEAARREATALYRDKQWDDAADVLREAADATPSKKEASRLRATARSYEQVGDHLSDGQRYFSSDSPRALASFKKAMALDASAGGGAHDGFIGARIGQVAPRAAGSLMARRQFADARRACDDAESYGSGSEVRMHRKSLENEAEKLVAEASALDREGDRAGAISKAREAVKLVPKSSAAHGKAQRLLDR